VPPGLLALEHTRVGRRDEAERELVSEGVHGDDAPRVVGTLEPAGVGKRG
jgi:hypothetical protein